MPQIAPSILAADFANLAADCRRVLSPAHNCLHIDVMDGVFVPNISLGVPVLASLKQALPQVIYDVHLMMIDPLPYIQAFAKAGASSITFHVEANSPVEETIACIHKAGCKAGLSLRPGTTLESVYPYLAQLDSVLVMSVEPGFGGQAFQPEALQRIQAIRAQAQQMGKQLTISVDGGINPQTGPQCIAAGANLLVAGNAVFTAENPAQIIAEILGE